MQRGCELCEGVAALYCAADKAHICWTCDAKVHSANFLVARHTRSVLCTTCATPTPWRTSGANPTPLLTGQLCVNCSSQGESQGECTTRDNNNNNDDDPIINSNNRIATAVTISSGCSTSNNPSSSFAVVRDSPCTQSSTPPELTSSNSSSTTTASTTTTSIVTVDSVSSRISACHPKRLAPGGVVQIATRALQDVNRSVSRGQCECRDGSHEHEATVCGEGRGCSSSESAKQQQYGSMRSAAAMAMAVQQVPVASTSRVMRTLAKWHWDLHLSSPGTVPLALRMFRKVSRALAPAVLSNAGLRVTLAACLRLAAGLDEAQVVVPKASEVAACAGVSMRRLAMTEIHLLALLGWRRFPIWAGVRS